MGGWVDQALGSAKKLVTGRGGKSPGINGENRTITAQKKI